MVVVTVLAVKLAVGMAVVAVVIVPFPTETASTNE